MAETVGVRKLNVFCRGRENYITDVIKMMENQSGQMENKMKLGLQSGSRGQDLVDWVLKILESI